MIYFLQGKHGKLIGKRLQVLIEIKETDKPSQRENYRLNNKSILKWRRMYIAGGICKLKMKAKTV